MKNMVQMRTTLQYHRLSMRGQPRLMRQKILSDESGLEFDGTCDHPKALAE